MKQKTRWHDALVLAAVLCAAFLIVTGTQQITGRIDGVASMVFVLAVFFDLDLYGWLCVWRGGFPDRRAGREFCVPLPLLCLQLHPAGEPVLGHGDAGGVHYDQHPDHPHQKQEQLRMESETEKMRATLLRAVSHDLRTPLTSIYGACSTVIENYDSLEKEQKLKTSWRSLFRCPVAEPDGGEPAVRHPL